MSQEQKQELLRQERAALVNCIVELSQRKALLKASDVVPILNRLRAIGEGAEPVNLECYDQFCRSEKCVCANVEAKNYGACNTRVACFLKNHSAFFSFCLKELFRAEEEASKILAVGGGRT